jgi:hypothetical protein
LVRTLWCPLRPAPSLNGQKAAGAVGRYSVLHHRVKNDAKDER